MKSFPIYSLIFLAFLLNITACEKDPEGDEPEDQMILVEYEACDSLIANPERGMYSFQQFTSGTSNRLSLNQLQNQRANGMSLVYTTYTMLDYRDKLIPEDYLQLIRDNMEILREGGSKTVLRFRYTNSQSQSPYDAPEELVHQHVAQLKPILQEYSDVIAVLEAGFIGVWGEWYYTDHFNFQPSADEYGPRRRLLDALLDALPENRMICVRYPAAKIYSFEISHTDTITRETAHNGSDLSRIAGHNDCFLADQDDRGTFGGNRNFRRFWEAETRYVTMGGETCGVSVYSGCDVAVEAFEKYHWSFLNTSYHPAVLGEWNRDGCMDEIKRRLGYRLVLTEGSFSEKAEAGNPYTINLKLENRGFAAPYNPRDVEIIFVSQSNPENLYKAKLEEDPRFWLPQEDIEVQVIVGLPNDMPEGNYDLFLNLPDPEPTLANRMEFSIRLSNTGTWDYTRGFNKLHTVNVEQSNKVSSFSGILLEKAN